MYNKNIQIVRRKKRKKRKKKIPPYKIEQKGETERVSMICLTIDFLVAELVLKGVKCAIW